MRLEIVQGLVSFALLFGAFVASCAWYSWRQRGETAGLITGGLALLLGLAGVGYMAACWFVGPIR